MANVNILNFALTNRYAQLLQLAPRGEMWDADGLVLPFRGTEPGATPYEFLFSAGSANANKPYRVYINTEAVNPTVVVTDAAGDVVVPLRLPLGRCDIRLQGASSADSFRAYVTTRNTATWMAAWAEILEDIDVSIEEVRRAPKLSRALAHSIEDLHGRLVNQPRDLATALGLGGLGTVEDYRRVLRDLRQAYRWWGARLAGMRQAVSSITAVNPLTLSTFIPRRAWYLGDQFVPDGGLDAYARRTSTDLSDLTDDISAAGVNAAALTFIVAATLDSDPNVVAGPFPALPNGPERLIVAFTAGYLGGDVIIDGLDQNGDATQEVFSPPATPPGADVVINRPTIFSVVTGVQKTAIAGGADTFSVGLATSRFVSIVRIGSFSPPTVPPATYRLLWAGPTDSLSWGLSPTPYTAGAITAPYSGRYTVGDSLGANVGFYGLALDVGGAGYLPPPYSRLRLEFDRLGEVDVELRTSPANPLAANVAADIATFCDMTPTYGGVRATATISFSGPATAGDDLTLEDVLGTTLLFRFLGVALAPEVPVPIGVSANDSAVNLATAINASGLCMMAAVVSGVTEDVVITQGYSGNTSGYAVTGAGGGNTVIVATIAAPTWVAPAAFAGGTDSANYGAAGVVASAVIAATGNSAVALASPTGVNELTASSIRISSTGADATLSVLGLPRVHALTTAPIAVGRPFVGVVRPYATVTAAAPATARFPTLPTVVLLPPARDDQVYAALPDPDFGTALEVHFDPLYTGNAITIVGLDCHGDQVTETFAAVYQGETVATGTAAVTADGGWSYTFAGALPSSVRAGMYFTVAGPASEIIDYVGRDAFGDAAIHLRSALGPMGAWTVSKDAVVKGEVIFRTFPITLLPVQQSLPVGAGVGTFAVHIRDGADAYGYDIRIGRNTLTQSGVAGTIASITPDTPPHTAVIDLTGYVSTPAEAGGYVEVVDADAPCTPPVAPPAVGTNDGVHRIFALSPTDIGATTVGIEHERAVYGREFALEVPPAAATWAVYAAGEVHRVIAHDPTTGVLTLLGEGPNTAWAAGADVELAQELPHEVRGPEMGFGTVTVDIDRALAPSSALTLFDDLVITGEALPDGWSAYAAAGAGASAVPSRFGLLPLGVLASGGADALLSRHVPRVAEYAGFRIAVAFWVHQHLANPSTTFQVNISFDGGYTFSSGIAFSVPETYGNVGPARTSDDPTFVPYEDLGGNRYILVPPSVTDCVIQLQHVGSALGNRFSVERAIVVALPVESDFFLERGTILFDETSAAFGEVLYVWSPADLNSKENLALGVPIAPERGVPSVANRGHIDRIANAHGYWERFDISTYDSAGAAINVRGVYTEAEWSLATLTNLSLVIGTPSRLTHVIPTLPSLVSAEALTVDPAVPHNATLSALSTHEGFRNVGPAPALFPEGAKPATDWLFADGLSVPSTAASGAYSTATIGTGGADDNVIITVTEPGDLGDTFDVVSSAPGAGPAPLNISFDTTALRLTISLAVDEFAALVPSANTAILISEAISALPGGGFSATFTGNGTGPFTLPAAAGPVAFAGADVTPWRFVDADIVQVDPSEYSTAIDYTLDYERLTRAESDVIDLGAAWEDYLWLVDVRAYRRADTAVLDRTVTELLTFRADYRATLSAISNLDPTTATLQEDTGLRRTAMPTTSWRFEDARTVSLSPGAFNPDALYTLTYVARVGTQDRPVDILIETRSTPAADLAAARIAIQTVDYAPTQIDAVEDPTYQWHQIRVTLTNVPDDRRIDAVDLDPATGDYTITYGPTRSVRVESMGFRGVNIYDVPNSNAPGLVPVCT